MLEDKDKKVNEAAALVTNNDAGQSDKNVSNVISEQDVIPSGDPIDENSEVSEPADTGNQSVKDMLTKMLNTEEEAGDAAVEAPS